jgi:hypothetical protein
MCSRVCTGRAPLAWRTQKLVREFYLNRSSVQDRDFIRVSQCILLSARFSSSGLFESTSRPRFFKNTFRNVSHNHCFSFKFWYNCSVSIKVCFSPLRIVIC